MGSKAVPTSRPTSRDRWAYMDEPSSRASVSRRSLRATQPWSSAPPGSIRAWGRNFVLAMLRLMRERDGVGVVSDQVGTPTWARKLAEAIWAVADRRELRGIHHWTDAGVASWYDFAVAIQEEALALGLLSRAVPIRPHSNRGISHRRAAAPLQRARRVEHVGRPLGAAATGGRTFVSCCAS